MGFTNASNSQNSDSDLNVHGKIALVSGIFVTERYEKFKGWGVSITSFRVSYFLNKGRGGEGGAYFKLQSLCTYTARSGYSSPNFLIIINYIGYFCDTGIRQCHLF